MFCTFWLENCSSLIWPAGSAPAALASLLFDPPEPQIIGKTQCLATFLPFRVPGSSFFWDFLFFNLLSSSRLFSDSAHLCFSSVDIVGNLTSKLPSHINITSSTAQGGSGSFKNRKPIGELGCCESGMAERSHWWTERCLISFTLSLSFSLFLSVSLSFSDYLRTYLWSIYLPICLSISLSIYLPIYLRISLSTYLSIL